MSKPEWLVEQERYREQRLRFRRCMNCTAGGDFCGQTNYIPKVGRLNMYKCRKHPSVKFYRDTYACEDFEPRR